MIVRFSIPVRCQTNLEKFQYYEWPTILCAPPEIGHRVEGRRGDDRACLRVVGIEHTATANGEPYLSLELGDWK